MSHGDLRVALVGYGVGGRFFHAPFITAAVGIEVAAVVTRSRDRRAQLERDLPGVPALDDLAAALAEEPDLVVITTPPETHRDLALEAVAGGIATIVDKPFAPDAATAIELRDAAHDRGVPLGVFYNRRWDADVRTLRSVLRSGRIGNVQRFTSRMDQDDPSTFEATPAGGMLRDLGSHLVDQALWLFGPVDHVYAELDWTETATGRADSAFSISLAHVSGVRSTLTASKLNRAAQRELRVLGDSGSFVSNGTDVQAEAVLAGRRPTSDPDWGLEAEDRWGVLSTAEGRTAVPSEQGAYQHYYTAVAAALRSGSALPVDADAGVAVARVLDAGRESDRTGQVVEPVR